MSAEFEEKRELILTTFEMLMPMFHGKTKVKTWDPYFLIGKCVE
jgi:hypothetical protein